MYKCTEVVKPMLISRLDRKVVSQLNYTWKFFIYWHLKDGVNKCWNGEMETSSCMETWPQNFKPTLIGNSKFFEINKSLLVALGVKVHVKKKGYKDLDNLLKKHGRNVASVWKV